MFFVFSCFVSFYSVHFFSLLGLPWFMLVFSRFAPTHRGTYTHLGAYTQRYDSRIAANFSAYCTLFLPFRATCTNRCARSYWAQSAARKRKCLRVEAIMNACTRMVLLSQNKCSNHARACCVLFCGFVFFSPRLARAVLHTLASKTPRFIRYTWLLSYKEGANHGWRGTFFRIPSFFFFFFCRDAVDALSAEIMSLLTGPLKGKRTGVGELRKKMAAQSDAQVSLLRLSVVLVAPLLSLFASRKYCVRLCKSIWCGRAQGGKR